MKRQLQRLLASRSLISTQLFAALGSAVALTVAASLVGWLSFNQVGNAQSRVNDGSVPELAAAFGVAQYGNALAAAAPRLTAAQNQDEFASVSESVTAAQGDFAQELAALEELRRDDAGFQRIRENADTLIANISAVESDKAELFELAEDNDRLRLVVLPELRRSLDNVLVEAIDDQLFYTVTGYRSRSQPADPPEQHFSQEEVDRYRYLSALQSDANIAAQLLASAFALSDAAAVEPLKEQFESAAERMQRNLAAVAAGAGSGAYLELQSVFRRLFELGTGPDSEFTRLERELRLVERQSGLLDRNRDLTVELLAEVNGLVAGAQASTQEATEASGQAIFTGRAILLGLSVFSIIGAALIAWLFVWRVLLRRLGQLSAWMRRMANGDLESYEEISGRDEVAEMAAALEVFRRHALEVQRLNLVEKLATELQDKNDELEVAMGDLHKAQDQIVTREKLAALGQLTAGVAHEIRNPLNFIKNFSESSEELLTEFQEVLDEDGVTMTDDQRGLLGDISQDLTGNLERIRSHSERANRIVQDMLAMGRSSSQVQSVPLNSLIEQHAGLAYHSARATNPDFNLTIHSDYDPAVGELEVIPHDLGRVFLNMVSNACYATNERRESGGDRGYVPSLWLGSKRLEDRVQVTIRDNGVGIPQEAVDKIFNPFFTTKPTDQGTGLGLALSSDIVRQHGGSISVDTAVNDFTEMTIELPLEPSEFLGAPEPETEPEPAEALADD